MNYHHDKVMEAVIYGHSCAMRLKLRLDDPTADDGSVSSYDLAQFILDCFSIAISSLSDEQQKSNDDQFSNLSSKDSSSPLHSLMSNSNKRKISSTGSSENWRDNSPDPIYDGLYWRKYGQKYIKRSNYQRSYYRCAYHKDQNCGATKHEEKIKDNPPVYRTTYFGQHTCQSNHNQDAIFTTVTEPVYDTKNVRMIRFEKEIDQKKKTYSDGFSSLVKDKEDLEQPREITGDDQDVLKENKSLPLLGSCHPSSSCDIESDVFNSELVWNNLDSWDSFDEFDWEF